MSNYFAFLKLSKYLIILLFLCIFFSQKINAQILSVTPNSYHIPTNFTSFQLPTATDVVIPAGPPLQVVVATTPEPRLYWDDNAGNKSSILVSGFTSGGTVLVDDVALAIGPSFEIYAYVTTRVLLPNNTTELHLMIYRWDNNFHQFFFSNLPSLIDTRPTSADIMDGMRISTNKTNGRIVMVWQKGGNIKCNAGYVKFSNGSVFNYDCQGCTLFSNYAGNLSNPDVSNTGDQTLSHFVTSALNNNNQVVVELDHPSINVFSTEYSVYTTSNIIRYPRVASPHKYAYAITFNEINNTTKSSTIKLLAGEQANVLPVQTINTELENNCSNNINYKYTGLPSISRTKVYYDGTNNYIGCKLEVCWQQIFCNGTDFCSLNAISKRFDYLINSGVQTLTVINNNNYFHLNNDLTKNSFFTSIAFDEKCQQFYSFDIMDKTTNLNGLVAYKNSNCDGIAIRSSLTAKNENYDKILIENVEQRSVKNILTIYPNPSNDFINIESDKNFTKIEVIDNIGNVVKTFSNTPQKIIKLNITGLLNGQYIIKINYKEGDKEVRKIMIQH